MVPGRHSDVPMLITKKDHRAQAGHGEPLAMPAVETEVLGVASGPCVLSGALQNASTLQRERLRPREAGTCPRPQASERQGRDKAQVRGLPGYWPFQ